MIAQGPVPSCSREEGGRLRRHIEEEVVIISEERLDRQSRGVKHCVISHTGKKMGLRDQRDLFGVGVPSLFRVDREGQTGKRWWLCQLLTRGVRANMRTVVKRVLPYCGVRIRTLRKFLEVIACRSLV